MIRKFVYTIVIDHNYTVTMHDPIIIFIYGVIEDLYQKNSHFSRISSMRCIRLSTVATVTSLLTIYSHKDNCLSLLFMLT